MTAEYWHRYKSDVTGFRKQCKTCRTKYSRRYYEANTERQRENVRRYREANLGKVRERDRQYYKSNADKKREYDLQYREANADKIREQLNQWREANPDKVREYRRRYREANPDKMRVHVHKRMARKRALPDTMTAQDWQHALIYFNGCCAVCGRQLNDLFGEHTAAMDHWIPLTSDDCPGTIPQNIIPLCHGIDGCNNKKSSKDPETWLIETYGTRKARQIMARIQAYFDSLPGSTDEDQGAA